MTSYTGENFAELMLDKACPTFCFQNVIYNIYIRRISRLSSLHPVQFRCGTEKVIYNIYTRRISRLSSLHPVQLRCGAHCTHFHVLNNNTNHQLICVLLKDFTLCVRIIQEICWQNNELVLQRQHPLFITIPLTRIPGD